VGHDLVFVSETGAVDMAKRIENEGR